MQNLLEMLSRENKEDIRFFKVKNKTFFMINNPSFIKQDKPVKRIVLFNESFKELGQTQYLFYNDDGMSVVNLLHIFLDSKKDFGKGLGAYMINFLNEVANKNGYDKIYGTFAPKNTKLKPAIKKFYLRNGYKISKTNNIYKEIDKEEIEATKKNTVVLESGHKAYKNLKNFKSDENYNSEDKVL
jgi:hypothetical protein